MIKGLYFKLHDDIKEEKQAYEFFNKEASKLGISKLKLLLICVNMYRMGGKLHDKD